MDLSKILAISGKPGLFRNIAQTKTGVVVESLIDGKRFPAFSHERISSLAEISIFTTGEDVSLKTVLKKIFEKYQGQKVLDHKASGPQLRDFMDEILPDYDKERVYSSDIKKLVMWYNLLVEKGLLDFSDDENEENKPAADEGAAQTAEAIDEAQITESNNE